jgi:hypothetical protein
MIVSKYTNIFAKIGSNFSETFYVKDLDNNPIDLILYTIEASFSNSILPQTSVNASTVSTTTLTSNITNAGQGIVAISATSTQTTAFKYGRYFYQVNLIDSSLNKYRAFEGILTVDP